LAIKVTIDVTNVLCAKKNRKKKMVQDYRYLNSWTIKNNYLLPLISDLKENVYKDGLEIEVQQCENKERR